MAKDTISKNRLGFLILIQNEAGGNLKKGTETILKEVKHAVTKLNWAGCPEEGMRNLADPSILRAIHGNGRNGQFLRALEMIVKNDFRK